MNIPELDALVWLYIALKLLDFLVHAGVAFATARGWIGEDLSHGVLNVIR